VSRSLPNRVLHSVFSKVNRRRYWWQLPTTQLKALNLLSLRLDLRDLNLFDTETPIRKHGLEEAPPEALKARRPDGPWNDLDDAEMGSAGTAFTRNVNPKRVKPEKPPRLYDPSPRTVSLELMTRDTFKPAINLNVLAAAWIQFENHKWFFHGRGKADEVLEVPLEQGDDWPEKPDAGAPHGGGPSPSEQLWRQRQIDRLRQHRDALVGRLADLWRLAGEAERDSQVRGRQAEARLRRSSAPRSQ
jgi:hypothetical protein